MVTDTIAAIATAAAEAGIGVIRISGPEAFDVADRIFRPKNGDIRVSAMDSHTIHYGYIVDGEEIVDEVLLLVMRAPRTYTREDVVEIDCHGGAFVMQRLLDTVLKYGARPAEPGEFTKRAFLSGRIDLSQAEAVIDLINAKSELARRSSVSQLRGSVLAQIREIRGELLHELAFLEAALDDPEHYNTDDAREEIGDMLTDAEEKVRRLLISADNGKILKEGISTVIVGKPNVGKSTLLNVLVGEERAIVTEIAGTTRDILEEQIRIGGLALNVIDTAGIRSTEDTIEKIGVSRALEYMERADLIIYVVDSSTELDENDDEIIRAIRGRRAIVLLNKSDLPALTTESDLKERLETVEAAEADAEGCPDRVKPVILAVSAKEGQGIRDLEDAITTMFFDGKVSFNDEVYITSARQKALLAEAEQSLQNVMASMESGLPEDFWTIDMMSAYEELGAVIGESVGDDVVDAVFRDFCMGK